MGNARNVAFWVVLFLLILALFNLFNGTGGALQSREITYSDFVAAAKSGEVAQATLDGEQIRFRGTDNQDYVTISLLLKIYPLVYIPHQIEILESV